MWQKKIKKIKKINYRMAGVISIKIMEESAEESRKQRLYKNGTLIDEGRLSFDKRRWQLGFGEVIKRLLPKKKPFFITIVNNVRKRVFR
jgi:hypothetical protein